MEKTTLTARQLIDLRRALSALDAVKGQKEGEIIQLEFDPKTRYRLMRAATVVEREALAVEKTERKLAQENGVYDGMEKNPANAVKWDAFRRAMEAVLETEVTVELPRVTLAELLTPTIGGKAKANPVPQSVLNKLAVMIEDE